MDKGSFRDYPDQPDTGLAAYLSDPFHLRELVDGLPAPLVAISPEGAMVPLNRAARESAWAGPAEGEGTGPWRAYLAPQVAAGIFGDAGKDPPPVPREFRADLGRGDRFFRFEGVHTANPPGLTGRAVGVLRDLTDVRQADSNARKAVEEELAETRALLDAAMEQTNAGVLIADAPSGTIRFRNSAALGLLGGSEEDLTGTPTEPLSSRWQAFTPDGTPLAPEDLPLARAIRRGEASQNVELEVHPPDGEPLTLLANAVPIRGEAGDIIAGVVVFHDVTERKKAEAALRQSEEKYEKAFAFSASAGTISRIPSGEFVDVNEAFTEYTGITRDEALGRTAVDLGLIISEPREEIRRQLEAHGRVNRFEMEANTRLGARTALVSACIVELEAGPHFLVSAADITDRIAAKNAVEAQLAFEETISSVARTFAELPCDRLHQGFEEALKTIGSYLEVDRCGLDQVSTDNGTLRVTNEWRVEGFSNRPDRGSGDLLELYPHMTAHLLSGNDFVVKDRLEVPEDWREEREYFRRSGIRSAAHVPLLIEGEIVGDLWIETVREKREWTPETLQRLRLFGSIFANTLNRQRAEESAREAWEFTEAALDSQIDTFFVFDPNSGQAVRWNRAFQEVSGYSDQEIARMKAPDSWYDPKDLEMARRATERILKEGAGTVELSLITKDGTRIPTEYRVSLLVDEAGEATHMIAVGRDITERKRAESVLRASEAELRLIYDHVPAFVSRVGRDLRFRSANRKFGEISGTDAEGLRGCHVRAILGDRWAEEAAPFLENAFRAKTVVWEQGADLGLLGRRTLSAQAVPEMNLESGEVDSVIVLMTDTTDRKLAEEALRKNDERYQALIENIPGVTWVADTEGRTLFISPNVEEIYGYSQEEVYEGDTEVWFERVHPEDREGVEGRFEKLIRQGEPFDVEYRIQRKDGRWVWLHDRAVARFTDGDTPYAYGVFTDMTEKKRLENQVVEISEWERQRMGQELHDDLGQQLTGLSALSSSLRARLASEDRPEQTDAARIEEIARGAVLYTRNLARGLFPHDVTGESLPEAIRSLGKTTEKIFGISCPVRFGGSARGILEEEALHLFRICQESIQNAVKHGKATTVSVSLEVGERSFSLQIDDDGRGFGSADVPEGMGLSVMRCRADLLGGSLVVGASPGGGTSVLLSVGRPSRVSAKAERGMVE